MAQITEIHRGKTPPRIHYLAEWAERRGVKQADFVRAIETNKSTVSRWFSGSLPSEENLLKIVEFLELEEVSALFRHPDDDWIAKFFRDRRAEERQRAMTLLEAAFPRKRA